MRNVKWMLAVAAMFAVGAFSAPVTAQMGGSTEKKVEGEKKEGEGKEGEGKEEPKEEDGIYTTMLKPMLKDVGEVIDKAEYTDADVKSYLKHHEAVKKLFDADPKWEELSNENLKRAFEYMVKNEKYVAWAKEAGVDADMFLRKGLRLRMQWFKKNWVDEQEAGLKEYLAELEKGKADIPEEEFKAAKEYIEGLMKDLANARKFLEKTITGPTDAEKKATEDNKEALKKAFDEEDGDSEDGDEGEDEDGMK
ncbi:MAG: hypothetical protein IPK87_02290 [Planctomycetes bacterium]|nr:hypothetical protein [Planctomycetota bacterium]